MARWILLRRCGGVNVRFPSNEGVGLPVMIDVGVIENMLSAYTFSAIKYIEDDGSVTLGLNELDLAENGRNEEDAIRKMAEAIFEYSEDYYDNFALWYSAPNRKTHLPYVVKALIINDVDKIGELITCRPGEI